MNKPVSLTIGIPAYNEGKNIQRLINSLLSQYSSNYSLMKVIVFSDGSTDKTIELVDNIKNNKITLMKDRSRKGMAVRVNQIKDKCTSDVLLILNADIELKDNKFIEKLIKPIVDESFDLVSASLDLLPSVNFFDSMLNISQQIKNEAFNKFKNGYNIYTCHGPARAFSKKLYRKINFRKSVGDDAYSFLYSQFHNFKYKLVKDTKIYIKSPENFQDHERQSLRFYNSQKLFYSEFGEEFVKSAYFYPPSILVSPTLRYLVKFPVHVSLYIIILILIKVKSYFRKKSSDIWDISTSTKLLYRG